MGTYGCSRIIGWLWTSHFLWTWKRHNGLSVPWCRKSTHWQPRCTGSVWVPINKNIRLKILYWVLRTRFISGMFLSINYSIYFLFKNVHSPTDDLGEAKAPLESKFEASSSIVLFMCSFDRWAHKKHNRIYVIISSSSSVVSRLDHIAKHKRERAKREGWLKMVHQEILDKKN
jgi:hypothetical protein